MSFGSHAVVPADMSRPCRSNGCDRLAFGTHTFCCRECRRQTGVHGGRCAERQRQSDTGTLSTASEDSAEARKAEQLRCLEDLLAACLPDLSAAEQRTRWLRDVLRAFHTDRYPQLSAHQEISAALTEALRHTRDLSGMD